MSVVVAIGVRALRPIPEWPWTRADLVWTILYGANWHQIATNQDYFLSWVAASPLRHMWSIAIEEQFYLVWPIVMILMLKRGARRWLLPGIAMAAVVSAAAMFHTYEPVNPTRAYVGTDARAQELLVGAALAVVMQLFPTRSALAAPAASWLGGLSAVGVAALLIRLRNTSPLYYHGGALALSIAIVVVIWAVETHRRSLLGRVLGLKPLTWIGKISYGIYLWHWPVILMLPSLLVLFLGNRGRLLAQSGFNLSVLRIALTFLLATVSYYTIEWPIRHGSFTVFRAPRRVALGGVIAGCAALGAILLILRIPSDLQGQVTHDETACAEPACVVVNAGLGRPVLAVMGDSVAKSLGPAFTAIARHHRWTFIAAAHDRCTVIQHWVGVENWSPCYASIPVTQQTVLSFRPHVIVINDGWLSVDSYDDYGTLLVGGSQSHVSDIEPRLERTVTELTSTGAILVFMHVPPLSQPLVCADSKFAADAKCRAPAVNPRLAIYNAMLDRVASRHGDRVRIIDIADTVCPENLCSAKIDGVFIRFDTLHFSTKVPSGSRLV